MTRTTFNPKRQLRAPITSTEQRDALEKLAADVRYGGNPEHKRNPGDFELNPPSQPRQGKTLCDDAAIFARAAALELLKQGIRKGLVSTQERDGWPQNVWAVAPNGVALEAQREGGGRYHGYPMPMNDPLREVVVQRWEQS
jgi:hypothetical protein